MLTPTTSTMQILRAEPSHLETAASLFDAYRQFYEQPADLDGARHFLRERLANGESVLLLAVDDAGNGLGFTQLYPFFSSVGLAKVWVLNDLFVAPTARRQGVALALMDAAHRFARETGAVRVELATAADNHAAQALYDALGYERDSFFHYSFDLDGR